MFRDCIEYQKKRKRSLFSFKEGQFIVTNEKFKYPNQRAKIFAKGVFPAGFDEKHMVRILYMHNQEFEVIDCSYEEYLVEPTE